MTRKGEEADYVYAATKRLRRFLWTGIVFFSLIVPGVGYGLWVGRCISLFPTCLMVSISWSMALTLGAGHYSGFWKAFLRRKVASALVTKPSYTYGHRYDGPSLKQREILLMYQRRHPFKNQWIFPSAVLTSKDKDLRDTVARVVKRTAGLPGVAGDVVYSYNVLGGSDSIFGFKVYIYATALEEGSETLKDGKWINIADIINTPSQTELKVAPRFTKIMRELVKKDEENSRTYRLHSFDSR